MQICRTRAELRAARAALEGQGLRVGLVPTMGYLHDGHMALVGAARDACDRVIATIFVNPTQFGPDEDFDSYPRDTGRDLDRLRSAGVDIVFLPEASEMYAPDAETVVEATRLSEILIGRFRPGHFRGVATIVTKLLNLARPDAAFFGQKDYQQLCVIRRVARDLDLGAEIVGVPIVRESDGLAMSSRNVRLTADQRAAAPSLHRALLDAAQALAAGTPVAGAEARIAERLRQAEGAEIRSIDIRDAVDLSSVSGSISKPAVILLAVSFGDVLLIDNMIATPGRQT